MATITHLMQGTLDVLILRALAVEPMHGYAITRWIGRRTDGALVVQDAALYKALRRLEAGGALVAEWGTSEQNRRARYYRLTVSGRRLLAREVSAWRAYAHAIARVLEPLGEEA
jgi:PadR family transcriptional regulator, regulatory protein PadR